MNCRDRQRQALVLSVAMTLAACGSNSTRPVVASPDLGESLGGLANARWTWLSAQCIDGGLPLGPLGFERTLRGEQRGNRLLLTYDSAFADPVCTSTEVWSLSPVSGGQWWFAPEAKVTQPASADCGAREDTPRQGVLRLSGDTLEEIHFGSAWCRGFDVRFSYHRTPLDQLGIEPLVRRYVAHWNRRDPRAVASLFAADGVLVEPFTRSSDGSPVRHQGRTNVEVWLADAFATTPWLAIELGDIDVRSDTQATASWRYMDARLAEPVQGRNLFVMAGGEIFATEVQLLSPPSPRAQTAP